jgi:hypothetical protein
MIPQDRMAPRSMDQLTMWGQIIPAGADHTRVGRVHFHFDHADDIYIYIYMTHWMAVRRWFKLR